MVTRPEAERKREIAVIIVDIRILITVEHHRHCYLLFVIGRSTRVEEATLFPWELHHPGFTLTTLGAKCMVTVL
jgi:hypothetical protein